MDKYLRDSLRNISHIALDMDGTIYLSDTIFPFTRDVLSRFREMGLGYSFLTNNPTKSPADYLSKLRAMGIEASEDQICATSRATVDYVRSNFPDARRLFILGTPSLEGLFREEGFEIASDSPGDVPDIVIASFDTTLTYSRLCRAAWWVSKGVTYLATNPDRICPTDLDTVLVDCGSICKCIEHATGRRPDATLGKPNPDMLAGICRSHSLEKRQVAMVGDRIYTDIEMARRAGVFGVLVLSGESDAGAVSKAPCRPDLVCSDIKEFADLLTEARR
ncbi:MAG: HAD-IIA family hydrolase [Bacteroidales bacterium]|nr:HAD-IIA family hydrolase [Bacteroidales bacterium]